MAEDMISLAPFGVVLERLAAAGALGPEDAPHPTAYDHLLDMSLSDEDRDRLTAALTVIADRLEALAAEEKSARETIVAIRFEMSLQ